jgi:uncharacterized protein with GYD domain
VGAGQIARSSDAPTPHRQQREVEVAHYLIRAKLSQDAVRALLAKPQDRKAAVSRLIERLGGTLHEYFFAFGDSDIVLLIELPGNVDAAAAALVVSASGSVAGTETTVLVSMDDAVAAMKTAGEAVGTYAPPQE